MFHTYAHPVKADYMGNNKALKKKNKKKIDDRINPERLSSDPYSLRNLKALIGSPNFSARGSKRSSLVSGKRNSGYDLLVSPFSKEDSVEEKDTRSGEIIDGSVNGLQALWNKKTGTLTVNDLNELERNIVMSNGLPCVYLKLSIGDSEIYQKLVLNSYDPMRR